MYGVVLLMCIQCYGLTLPKLILTEHALYSSKRAGEGTASWASLSPSITKLHTNQIFLPISVMLHCFPIYFEQLTGENRPCYFVFFLLHKVAHDSNVGI